MSRKALETTVRPDDLGRLRLLIAFDALLRESSVGRAATALGLQSSAVSRMLGQLRSLYDDPLFIRTRKGLIATPLSEHLRLRVRALVEESERLLSPPPVPRPAREGASGWEHQTLIEAPPLSVSSAVFLEGQPSPDAVARRLSRIGTNADPQQRLSKYIATIGGGAGRSRPLTMSEAQDAASIILGGDADPIQIGAFFAVLQYRGASPIELAGFVLATRGHCRTLEQTESAADLDWPCYLSPRLRAPPWFIHAARLVANAGYRIVLHGSSGRGSGTEAAKLEIACERSGIAVCKSIATARHVVARDGIAYLPLAETSGQVQQLLALHRMTEMRGPMHNVIHLLNPLNAPASLLGAPNTEHHDLHREIARFVGMSNITVLSNRDVAQFTPFRTTRILRLVGGSPYEHQVPRHAPTVSESPEGFSSREFWEAIWSGAARDPGAEAVIIATAATALMTIHRSPEFDFEVFLDRARELWVRRRDLAEQREARSRV